jgi:hypothetical protein
LEKRCLEEINGKEKTSSVKAGGSILAVFGVTLGNPADDFGLIIITTILVFVVVFLKPVVEMIFSIDF